MHAAAFQTLLDSPFQLQRERDLTQEELDAFIGGDPVGASVAPDGVDRALLLPYTKRILPEDIIIGETNAYSAFPCVLKISRMYSCGCNHDHIAKDTKLGSGEFGVVHPGICRSEPVAIKLLKQSVDVEEFKAVLIEVKIMAYLGDHEYIVKFVGAEISEIAKSKSGMMTTLFALRKLLQFIGRCTNGLIERLRGNYDRN